MAESPDSMFNFDGGARVTSANTFVLKGLGDELIWRVYGAMERIAT